MAVWARVFVRDGKVVHIASPRKLYFEVLKVILIDTFACELDLPQLIQRKRAVALLGLEPKRLELRLVAGVGIEWHLAFRPVFLPIDLLAVEQPNGVHHFVILVGGIVAGLSLEPELVPRVNWQLQLRH